MQNARPRVLIVEDEYLVAVEAEYLVNQCGCAVVGPVANIAEAMQISRQADLDGAVIDVNLGGEMVWPVIEFLREQGVPFVLATGYVSAEIPSRFQKVPLVAKPLTYEPLRDALQAVGTIAA